MESARGALISTEKLVPTDVERYRQNAEECFERSQQARSVEDKAAWLKLGGEWLKLADEIEGKTRGPGRY